MDATVAAHAEVQGGVFTRAQAVRAGASGQMIFHRLRAGRWLPVLPKVYRLAGTPPTHEMRRRAALLWADEDAVVSHVAAARLYGFKYLGDVPAEPMEITTALERRLRHEGIGVHRAIVPKCDRRTKSGVAVTTPARTLIDIAGLFDRDHLKRILEGVLRDGLATVEELKSRIQKLGTGGRPGASALQSILDERSPDRPMTDSEGERLFLEALDQLGLPQPSGVHHQYGSERAGFWTEMDVYWEEIKLNVEIDHVATHGWAADIESDRARDNALIAEGVTVLRITHAQLQDALSKTMSNLAETMRRLYAQEAARGETRAHAMDPRR